MVFTNDAWRDLARLDGDGLVNDTFLFGVITHFDMARGGEIFSEGVADETLVGQQTA